MAGTISTPSISSIYAPIVGAQLTNTPTTYRQSFGSYTLSDYTEPNWIVELYVNNVLVDYVKSDASGFFIFEVPLVYGNSDVKLRFYGPSGEERTTLQNITIPFNFLPQKEFEYTVSTGRVEDGSDNLFSRVNFNYGLNRHMTVGGGIEYFSSVTSGKSMPFLNTSLSLTSSLLFSGEYVNGVRSKGILNYRMPSNLQFEIDYIKYDKDQQAINTNFLEDRKAIISMPVSFGNSTIYSRLTINQIVLPTTKYIMSDLLLSGSLFGVSVNSSTYASYYDQFPPYIYGNLSLSFRFPAGFIMTPQAQYDYNQKKLISVKCEIEKQLFGHSYLNMIYEKDFINNVNDYQIVFRYEFPFAQTSASVRRDNNANSYIQSANGSLMFDGRTNYLGTDNQPSVGKGGIIIVPFLDLNCNGRRDKGEPKAFGLNFSANGGRIERNNRDTTIRIFDLEPYTTYTIELDRNSFDNISWQIKKPTISVSIDPNQFKLVQIPIAVVGEGSGTVYLSENNSKKGQGRITVCFYRSDDSSLAASTLTEDDGFFSYLGLAPGSYVARIDAAQLRRLNMISSPTAVPVNILQSKDGYVVDGLEFVLQSLQGDTSVIPVKEGERITMHTEKLRILEEKVVSPPQVAEKKVIPPPQIAEEKVEQPLPIIKTNVPCIVTYNEKRKGFVLQIASCTTLKKANSVAEKADKFDGLTTFEENADIPSIGRRYRVFIGVFKTREEAVAFCQQFNFDL
jgi:cell division septation protein DedD